VGSKRPAGGFIRLKEHKTTAHISENDSRNLSLPTERLELLH